MSQFGEMTEKEFRKDLLDTLQNIFNALDSIAENTERDERIEKLEIWRDTYKFDTTKLLSLKKELSELKEQIEKHFADNLNEENNIKSVLNKILEALNKPTYPEIPIINGYYRNFLTSLLDAEKTEKQQKQYRITIYCIDCKIFFSLNKAYWENSWVHCPQCKGQNYTIRERFSND